MLKYNNKIVCNKVHLCNNIFTQGFGLMFRGRNSVEDTAWVFYFEKKRKISLTMLFVFFPIDVIFIDNKKIVEMTQLMPWSFYNPKNKTNYCIELKYGTIEKYKMKVGDMMDFC